MRIVYLFLLPVFIFASQLKIVNFKEQGGVLDIYFNKNIEESYFKKHSISTGVYYDVEAEYTLKKRTFRMGNNNFVTVAQNNKKISRIVIQSQKIGSLNFKINKNILSISFGLLNRNIQPKDDAFIINLFESIDSGIELTNDKLTDDSNTPAIDDSSIVTNNSASSAIQTIKSKTRNQKIIVVDPGHGGKDCGAQINSVCEKTITLAISRALRKILEDRGYAVYITRDRDVYISLTDRTNLANEKGADVFVSIHANSLHRSSKNYSTASGIETYFLSTARSERARKVAEAENKDDIDVMNYFSKLSFLNSINSQRLLASNKLAIDVQFGMLVNTRKLHSDVVDGGVREGPFWVLVGALMPSILVETGYMSNSMDFARLQDANYQERLALGIADGIDNYFLKNFGK